MKLAITFGVLCAVCLVAYLALVAVATGSPQAVVGLSVPMILASWGAGAFFILAIVFFIIKK